MITVFDMSTGERLCAAAAADQQPAPDAPAWPAADLRLQTLAAEPPAAPRAALPPDLAAVPVTAFLRRQGG